MGEMGWSTLSDRQNIRTVKRMAKVWQRIENGRESRKKRIRLEYPEMTRIFIRLLSFLKRIGHEERAERCPIHNLKNTMTHTKSPFENARKQMLDAASLAKFNTNSVAKLLEAERVLESTIVLEMDDGTVESFPSYRSQHSSAR